MTDALLKLGAKKRKVALPVRSPVADSGVRVAVPTEITSYYQARSAPIDTSNTRWREVALSKLRWLGVHVQQAPDGSIVGQLGVDPARYPPIGALTIGPRHAFEVRGENRLCAVAPSALAHIGPVAYLDVQSLEHLENGIMLAWRRLGSQLGDAVRRARWLAPNATHHISPWRIEGVVRHGGHEVTLLFSSLGDRACISAVDGRPIGSDGPSARIILPVDGDPRSGPIALRWQAALQQATASLSSGPAPRANSDAAAAHGALETSYDREPIPAGVFALAPPLQSRVHHRLDDEGAMSLDLELDMEASVDLGTCDLP